MILESAIACRIILGSAIAKRSAGIAIR
jgi:hypothetical protein